MGTQVRKSLSIHLRIFPTSNMKLILAAVIIGLVAVYASNDQHISCYHCPYGFLPGEACLTEDDDFGHAQTCRFGFDNACESLIIENRTASIYYNRKCARKPVTVRFGATRRRLAFKEKENMMEKSAIVIQQRMEIFATLRSKPQLMQLKYRF